jgi:hypothetical protein
MPKTGHYDQLSAFRNGCVLSIRNFISGRKGKLILINAEVDADHFCYSVANMETLVPLRCFNACFLQSGKCKQALTATILCRNI